MSFVLVVVAAACLLICMVVVVALVYSVNWIMNVLRREF